MKKLEIRDFIEKNYKILIIFGVFLAVLSVSFDYINRLNPIYAGYLAVLTCLAIILLIIEILPKEKEELSLKSSLFLGAIIGITGIIILVITKTYNEESQNIFSFACMVLAFGVGFFLASKLIKLEEKFDKKVILNFILFIISIIILRYFDYVTTKILNMFSYLNVNQIIHQQYLEWFIVGFFLMVIIWGLLEVGLNRIAKAILYKKVFLKLQKKIKKIS